MKIFFLFAIGFNFLVSENWNVVGVAGNFRVSSRLLHSICGQRRVFSQSKILQEPVKMTPKKSGYLAGKLEGHENQNQDFLCGWFSVSVSLSNSSSANKVKYKNCKELAVTSGKENGDSRIVGGQDATAHQFPSMVELISTYKQHVCGGVIISEKWILTAAHCLDVVGRQAETDPAVTAIVAGEHDRRTEEGTEQVRQVEKLFMHPDFDDAKQGLDVGLIKLTEPLEFNENVSPVTLPTKATVPAGVGQICGWGKIKNPDERNEDPDAPDQFKSGFVSDSNLPPADEAGMAFVLQTSPIPMVSREECQKLLDAAGYPEDPVAEGDFCTAYPDKDINVCNGDSGSPIFDLNAQQGKQLVLGLVSNGPDFKCAGPNYPQIFTGVPYSLDWIQKTIEENG